MFVFFFYAVSSRHIEESFLMQRAVASSLLEQKFPASTESGELNFITFYDINDKVRGAVASRRAAVPLTAAPCPRRFRRCRRAACSVADFLLPGPFHRSLCHPRTLTLMPPPPPHTHTLNRPPHSSGLTLSCMTT